MPCVSVVCRPAMQPQRPTTTSSTPQHNLGAPSGGEQNKRKSGATNGLTVPVAPSRSQRRKNQQRAAIATHDDGSDGSAGSRSDADQNGASSRALGDQRGSQRRRSARHRNYLNRSQLHEAIELPDGYGTHTSPVTSLSGAMHRPCRVNHIVCDSCVAEQRTTPQGQVYYLQTTSGISTWHDPRVPRDLASGSAVDLGPLPSGQLIGRTPFALGGKFAVVKSL